MAETFIDGLKFDFTAEELVAHLKGRIEYAERQAATVTPGDGALVIDVSATSSTKIQEAFGHLNQAHGMRQIVAKLEQAPPSRTYRMSREELMPLGWPCQLDKDDHRVVHLQKEFEKQKKMEMMAQAQAQARAQAGAAVAQQILSKGR